VKERIKFVGFQGEENPFEVKSYYKVLSSPIFVSVENYLES
jgi:hypothetical protein